MQTDHEHPSAPVFERRGLGGRRAGAGRKPRRVITPRALGPRWYVIRLAPHLEAAAIRDLLEGEQRRWLAARPAFAATLPMVAVRGLRRGKVVSRHRMMFHGYGFVRFDAQADDWAGIIRVAGVARLFMTPSLVPIPCPVGLVEAVIADAPTRLALAPEIMPPRQAGEQLVVVSGAMAGFAAECIACDGVTTAAWVTIFGRSCAVTLPWAAFEAQ